MKVLIYGAGSTGRQVYKNIKSEYEVVGFLDGNPDKKGHMIIDDKICLGGVEQLKETAYEKIFIAAMAHRDIKALLLENGVNEEQITVDIPLEKDFAIRDTWLECFSKFYAGETYSVAEGGVFRGDFSKIINKCFPNSKLYLFDTFEGLDHRDVEYEEDNYAIGLNEGEFTNTSVDLVMSKMTYPDNVVIRQGYFPSTAQGIDDTFCFVNLDFILYSPILEGLRFFYPRMVRGGVILIHDYYNIGLPGVKDAVEDFGKELPTQMIKVPIGDDQSIAIIKV